MDQDDAILFGITQDLPGLIQQNEDQKSSIESSISDLQDQKEAINNKILLANKSSIEDRLDLKKEEFPEAGGVSPRVNYGETFGTNNITDWAIQVWNDDIAEYQDVYVYEGIGWDDDEQISTYVSDYLFGYDWIHHDPTDMTGNYGIQSLITALTDAVSNFDGNISKFSAATSVLDRSIQ